MKKTLFALSLILFVAVANLTTLPAWASDSSGSPDDGDCPGAHFCEDDDRDRGNPDDEYGDPERDPYPGDEDDGPDGTGGYDPYFLWY